VVGKFPTKKLLAQFLLTILVILFSINILDFQLGSNGISELFLVISIMEFLWEFAFCYFYDHPVQFPLRIITNRLKCYLCVEYTKFGYTI